jgi:hypothetical protein
MVTNAAFITFHRYYIWANRLRTEFDSVLANGEHSPDAFPTWFAGSPGLFMSHWYAALYVVIEGWRALGCSDQEIDGLLASPNADHLRRYRHGVCHFQPTYLDDRFVELMRSPNSVAWVRQLNLALGRWFLDEYERRRRSV